MTDVHVFGETGLIAACRDAGGKPAAIPFGVVFAPRGPKGTVATVEIAATPHGTVALRGPMVPRAAFPPGAERSGATVFQDAQQRLRRHRLRLSRRLHRDGGHRAARRASSSFGGYRFVVSELQDLVARPENGAGSLAVLPDALAGHRLAGTAADHDLVEQSLATARRQPAADRRLPRPRTESGRPATGRLNVPLGWYSPAAWVTRVPPHPLSVR